jgi:hypothetical protein
MYGGMPGGFPLAAGFPWRRSGRLSWRQPYGGMDIPARNRASGNANPVLEPVPRLKYTPGNEVHELLLIPGTHDEQ